MRHAQATGWAHRAWWLTVAALAFVACETTTPPSERTGEVRSAVFTNGDFEGGAAGLPPPSWTVQTFLNPGVTLQSPQTRAGLNLAAGGVARTVTLNSPPGSQPDPNLGAGASLRWPRYGNQCAVVNQLGAAQNVNSLSQTMTVAAGDVDPSDGQVHVRFVVAPVLQNPAHLVNQQPYYFVQLTNVTQSTILYADFNLSAQPGVPWKTVNGGTPNELDYTDWQLVDIAPGAAGIAMGDQVKLEVIAGGCSLGGHFGEVYVDGAGATVPGLFVSGTGPAQANAGTNITYTLAYKNGSAGAETSVVIDFTTPPNTTFQSLAPPAGATCVTPVVGTAGTVTCTFTNPVAAGAGGSFTITVNINAAATGTIVCGNYDIKSTQETALLGNKVLTTVGCAADTDCTGGAWCNETAKTCGPKLANGTVIPTDPPHTAPTLNGTCTAAAGTLVCIAGVCDTGDNRCGFLNGTGPCTVASAGVVCRSGVCDPDAKCGYAVGDGPCTLASAGTVCRSGVCSVNGTCEPVGGCNVDADCSGGNWCTETTHTCTAKLANGTLIPTDPPHTGPTLNGTCTAAAATLVCAAGVCDPTDNRCGLLNSDGPCTVANGGTICRSGVCDPDGKCGYAVGDGPCTAANGVVVCRSTSCSVNGTCDPIGGCNVDGDCSGSAWCRESTHVCTPTIANGGPIPTDPPHVGPTLNGTCTAAAATLTCQSGVCDSADNDCGYRNGDGPCTVVNGGVVCRGGGCSPNASVCIPVGGCDVDADCTATQWCNTSTFACTPKLPNAQPVPTVAGHIPPLNGTCTAAVGSAVCASGVCDTADNDCGYGNGDGPCNAVNGGVVCRSGACSVSGTCEPLGGCNVDGDCSGGNWCKESLHACTPKIGNGIAMPSDPPHTSPTLNGTCTAAAAALVCQSGVCDTDNECGYRNGDGPCTAANGGTVCRSGVCSVSGKCEPAGGCLVDADCSSGFWCNETLQTCTPVLANDAPIPTDAAHTSPTLVGNCTLAAGALVCQSTVCDTDNRCGYANGDGPCAGAATKCRSAVCDPDDRCGYANGDGPCTASNGGTVCRSTICATTGLNQGKCEQCVVDASCSGATPACDPQTNRCVQCTATQATACSGATPLCNTTTDACVACNGDQGDPVATEPCPQTTPYCNLTGANTGACGKCATNADCNGHPLGPICDPAFGTCGKACTTDGDCNTAAQWCNAPLGGTGACVPKLTNGTPLPTSPADVATCTGAVGARVCASGVCDPKDNKCGFLNSDGPCNGTPAECRSNACDKDKNCGYANGDGPCSSPDQCRSGKCNPSQVCVACVSDNDCPSADYCSTAGQCTPKEPDGQPCTLPNQCVSNACANAVCGVPSVDAGSPSPLAVDGVGNIEGGGCACSEAPGAGTSASTSALGFALLAVGAAIARARRLRSPSFGPLHHGPVAAVRPERVRAVDRDARRRALVRYAKFASTTMLSGADASLRNWKPATRGCRLTTRLALVQ